MLSIHLPIAGMSVIPVLTKIPLVLLPAHVAFLHLIIEPASSLAFENGWSSDQLMKQPPRSSKAPLFDRSLMKKSFLRGLFLLVALLCIYLIALERNKGEREARALVFSTMILANILLIHFRQNSREQFLRRILQRPSRALTYVAIGSLILLSACLYVPSIREMLSFSFLHPNDVILCFVIALFSTFAGEIFLDLQKEIS